MPTFSTVARPAYVYDAGADTWFPVGALSYAFVQTFQFTATASQTTFSGLDTSGVSLAYTPGAAQVYLNGVLLSPGSDYTATTGSSVVLVTGATVGDALVVIASGTFLAANTYTQAQVNALVAGGGSSVTDILMLGGM